MPYTWDGKYVESKADARTDTLGFREIGGVGQLIYHLFRFNDYKLEYDNNNRACAFPICGKDNEPEIADADDYTGWDLLASLCNLAKKIDDFNEPKSYLELIVEWCRNVAHPYNIDFIYKGLSDENYDIDEDGYFISKDGIFSIDEFMTDLGNLYQAARFYTALEDVCFDDENAAYNLYKDGRHFDGLPFFERYKHPQDVPDIDYSSAGGDLLKEMQLDSAHRKVYDIPESDGEFDHTPYDDYEKLRDTLIDMIPDFRIRLKVDPKTEKLVFSADVNSVFDIAWYTLARMLSEDPALLDKGKEKERPEGIMMCCRHCGDFIMRRNSRQEYCDKQECQRARNAKNQRDYRERRRIEKLKKKHGGQDNG